MKKFAIFLWACGLVFVLVSPAAADLMVVDSDTGGPLSNVNPAFWTGEDQNRSLKGQLNNANPTTEEAWLEALLGLAIDVSYIDKIKAPDDTTGLGDDDKGVWDYKPGFAWDYAVVKFGNFWEAWQDVEFDDHLSTDVLPHGISHITFFGAAVPVPEPATMLLLGFGLIGLAGIGRKRFFKKMQS